MKITRIERIGVRVPFLPGILPPPDYEEPMPGYPQPLGERLQDVLCVHTDAGATGYGMSGPYFERRDETPPELIGKTLHHIEPRELTGGGWNMALLDLMGKDIGWPLYRIFGGRQQQRVLVDYWISRMGPEDSAAAAERAVAQGFHGIKLKCKWEDQNVAERVCAMHEAAPGLRIVVDPNERFHTLENSLQLAQRLEAVDGLDVLFEDPFPKRDLREYKRLKEATSIPIAPHFQNPRQIIEAVQMEAIDAFNVAPSDWGFLDMARIAEAADVPVWQASNVDLGLFDAFRLHASAAASNCTLGSDLCGNFVHEHSLLKEPLVSDGYAIVPDGPGLGVELNWDAVAQYTVFSEEWR